MKSKLNKLTAAVILFFLWLTSACDSTNLLNHPAQTPTATSVGLLKSKTLHFNNEIVEFDYPEGLIIFKPGGPIYHPYPEDIDLGGDLIVGLADPHWVKDSTLYSSIRIFFHSLPPGSSMEDVMNHANKPVPLLREEIPGETGQVALGGFKAFQKAYRVASGPLWYTMRDIWLEKDNVILRVSFWEEAYEVNFTPAAETFRNSLKIHDPLPPIVGNPTKAPAPTLTPYPNHMLSHFESDLVSFSYPKDLVLLETREDTSVFFPDFKLGGELVAGLGSPRFLERGRYYRSIRIWRLSIPPRSNLESIFMDAYQPVEEKYHPNPADIVPTARVSTGGQQGLQFDYRIASGEPTYELRDVWLQKADQVFIISIWSIFTNPDDLSQFQSGADALIYSLVIK